jgi:purine-binding chemotaxis protein CheW
VETSVGVDNLTVLIFELEGHRYGLRTTDIREITRAALPTRLAQAPGVVEGVINVRGQIAVVLDMRARFQLPRRPILTSDVFLVCHVKERLVALRVDAVVDLRTLAASTLVPAPDVSSAALNLAGVFALPDGLVFLSDLPAFLSDAENESLSRALLLAEPGAKHDNRAPA